MGLLAAICLPTAAVGTGCKSSMPPLPSWKTPSFGFKKEPSADTLAGIGPTRTYPVSPSADAVPNPIESVAASTAGVKPQTGQGSAPGSLPGMAPGGDSPASMAVAQNPAAAIANGFPGPQPSYVTNPPAATNPAATPPGGSLFGQPPTGIAAAPTNGVPSTALPSGMLPPGGMPGGPLPGAGSVGALPASSDYTAVGYPLPGSQPSATVAAMPPSGFPGTAPTPPAASAPTTSAPALPPGGFAMPGIPPTTTASAPATPSTGFTMPGMTAPPAAPDGSQPAEAVTAAAPPQQDVKQTTGYTPGSTSGATSYPAGNDVPASGQGLFYR